MRNPLEEADSATLGADQSKTFPGFPFLCPNYLKLRKCDEFGQKKMLRVRERERKRVGLARNSELMKWAERKSWTVVVVLLLLTTPLSL